MDREHFIRNQLITYMEYIETHILPKPKLCYFFSDAQQTVNNQLIYITTHTSLNVSMCTYHDIPLFEHTHICDYARVRFYRNMVDTWTKIDYVCAHMYVYVCVYVWVSHPSSIHTTIGMVYSSVCLCR